MCPEAQEKKRGKDTLVRMPRKVSFLLPDEKLHGFPHTILVSLHTKQGSVCQQYYWKETRSGTLADAFFNLHTLLDTTKTFLFKSYLLSSWTDGIKKPLSLSVLPKELTRPEILTTQAAVHLATHWNLWPQFFPMVWNLQFHESWFLHLVLKTRSLSKHLRCYHYTS